MYLEWEFGWDPRVETKKAGDYYWSEAEKLFGSKIIDWQKQDMMWSAMM